MITIIVKSLHKTQLAWFQQNEIQDMYFQRQLDICSHKDHIV